MMVQAPTLDILKKRETQVLYDVKWKKFIRRNRLWRFVPFVDFVLAAGSMATGNVHPNSDFDVIVAASYSRIFTARFFSVVLFGLFGWRRKRFTHHEAATDKICLNHFVTEKSFKLSPPYNSYWQSLYENLVPVFGDPKEVKKFWEMNRSWMRRVPDYEDDLRHRYRTKALVTRFVERLVNVTIGNWFESKLKKIQTDHIQKSLAREGTGYKPRIIYTDAELEFHPDTQRIDRYLESEYTRKT